jgi:hypothetical protein
MAVSRKKAQMAKNEKTTTGNPWFAFLLLRLLSLFAAFPKLAWDFRRAKRIAQRWPPGRPAREENWSHSRCRQEFLNTLDYD